MGLQRGMAQKRASESQVLKSFGHHLQRTLLNEKRAHLNSSKSHVSGEKIQRPSDYEAKETGQARTCFHLGIEEEFQIIDPETRELRSHIQQILTDGKMILKEHVKPEMHQSVVELGTDICNDARDARREIEHIERIIREGTGADRQLMVWGRTQDMKAVVDQIVAETNEG
jgi:gamma-glutamyl:cysteine ligase YbdK (ATP-grasp superfamily)